jgi:flagellar basal-body rod modification protein FlgD
MSTTDSISSSTSTDVYGNTYTTAVSNDELESEDFITLMLTELSMQDPTDPVDSSSMLSTQLELSSLEANVATVTAMEALQNSFEQSALSSSASLIGNIIENGDLNDSGNTKQYKVSSVEGIDGEIYLTTYEISGYYDVYSFSEVDSEDASIDSSSEDDTVSFTNSDGDTYTFSTYGKTYQELSDEISAVDGITSSIVENSSGKYQMVTSISNANSSFKQSGTELTYSSDTATSYDSEAVTILYSSISKIY